MIVVLGGGLAGLSAAHALVRAGRPTQVIEKVERVGGLARTVTYQDFRYDLGGHRILTDLPRIQQLVEELLGDDLLVVERRSQILLRGRRVTYPLRPANALAGLGLGATAAVLADYAARRVRGWFRPAAIRSLEDWVVAHYGRTMFDLYFREYSEKVWGIPCHQIDSDWVAQRIDGLSLWQAVKSAFCRRAAQGIKTLTDTFYYPRQGIGQLADRLAAAIEQHGGVVRTNAAVHAVLHDGRRIEAVLLGHGRWRSMLSADRFISSIPLTSLVAALRPRPPAEVRAAAAAISFRALVTVTVLLRRQQATDLTWMYLPEKQIPFGRIHEPRNWSACLAPPGATHLVAEFFCNQHDKTWRTPDGQLIADTAAHLARLGLARPEEVIGGHVLRIPYAYPVFNLDYRRHVEVICDYLSRFRNLSLAGRSGTFSYLNMDRAMHSGLTAADAILARPGAPVTWEQQAIAAAPSKI